MNISEKFIKTMRSVFRIKKSDINTLEVSELLTYKANCFKNNIWYRGDSYELDQLYKQISNHNANFWGSVPTKGLEIRKIHTGLPKTIVNTLCNIVTSDLSSIETDDLGINEQLNDILEDNNFYKLVNKALKQTLVIGDGAFKISFDSSVSKYPIIEFVSGDRLEIVYSRDRVKEVQFFTEYTDNKGNKYTLKENYGKGYVNYQLLKDGKEVSIDTLEETKNLVNVTFDSSIMLAVPFRIFDSEKYIGRGQSIFDNKTDSFDSIDECWSQWMDAVRNGRAKTYIPDTLIPKNPETGESIRPNAFDNRFIKIEDDISENASNKIDTQQPQIPTNEYLSTYVTALDLCLQGLISPSTLGIDNKKLDNADAQREKEKATLYTRSIIINELTDALKDVVKVVINAYYLQIGQSTVDFDVNITFGEYASPSFESVVEVLSNPNTPMSIESKVEEMWGGSRSKEWIEQEVKRIKEQSGIIQMDEPALSNYEF